MRAALPLLLHLVFLLEHVATQSPPLLLADAGKLQKIVIPGVTVTLPCPVSGDKSQMLFEWSKDKESLITFGGHRLRVTPNGVLRIKGTLLEDTGIYTCRAVNGFGSAEHNTTLIVLDDGSEEEYDDTNYSVDTEEHNLLSESEDALSRKSSVGTKPQLLYVSEWNRSHSHKFPGSSVQLHCVATGQPQPLVTWTKDGGDVPDIAKMSRWALKLQNLQLAHSGNYTCTARNQAGTARHSFYIDVTSSPEWSRGKPEMTDVHPSNTTVLEGQTAVLQCIVRSSLPPHIEWLKRIEPGEINDEQYRDVIKVMGENFKVIKSSEVMERVDGSYFNKLVIQEPVIKDSGKYICLGANTNGYNYRSAYLVVLSRPSISSSSSSTSLSTDYLPFPILVAAIVLGIASIAGVVALMVYCKNRPNSIGSISGSTTVVPMVLKDTLAHPKHSSSKTCCSVLYESPNQSHPQVSVYVPECDARR